MDAGAEVKVESGDEVEDYDGSYACLICTESVRGTAALVCRECNSNPWHRACDKESKYLEKSVTVWTGASTGPGGQSEFIDLTGEGGGAAEVATLTGHGAREDAVPAVGGGVLAADVEGARVRRRVQELVALEAAARTGGALIMGRQGLAMAEKAEAGRAEAGRAGEAGRDTRVQAAGQQRMSRV